MKEPVIAWLLEAAILLGLVLLAASLAYGLMLAIFPQAILRASDRLNSRYSARRALRPMEIPRSTERFVYRHHLWVGGLLLTGVIAFFVLYFVNFPQDSVLARLASGVGAPLAGVMLDTLTGFMLVANGLIGILAAAMLWRPSVLKPLEAIANRWFSTRRALREAEMPREPLDRFINRRPRLAGVLIAAGAVYILAGLLLAAI